jgi:hypothetical protein
MECNVVKFAKPKEAAKPSMVKRAASFLGLAKQAPTVSKVSTLHTVG